MTIRNMSCCVCGNDAGRWTQHWNRDHGYGVCVACIKWLRGRKTSETEIADLYGKEGVNWGEQPCTHSSFMTDSTGLIDTCTKCGEGRA